VAEAMRQGIRNNLRSRTIAGETHNYFIFKHDGVKDAIPTRRERERPNEDYYILLPRYRRGAYSNPENAMKVAKTFVYPETDPNPNGGGNAFQADDDGDDYQRQLSTGDVVNDILVEEAYRLGSALPQDGETGEHVLNDQVIETWKQYYYAFEIQASKYDGNMEWSSKGFEPANRLYRVRVMVFRGFQKPQDGKPMSQPIFELDFEVAI